MYPGRAPVVFQAAKGLVNGRPFGYFNVTAFGAVGDGTTDDTTAIQAALDAAENGGTVIMPIPSVRWRTTATLTIPKGVRWLFDGMGDRNAGPNVIKPETTTVGVLLREIKGAKIEGLTLDMSAMGDAATGIDIHSLWWGTFDDVHVINIGTGDIGWHIRSTLAMSQGCYWNSYRDCSAQGSAGTGVQILGENPAIRVTQQHFQNLAIQGTNIGIDADYYGTGITFGGLNIESCTSDAAQFNNASSSAIWVTVVGGEMSGNGGGITGTGQVLNLGASISGINGTALVNWPGTFYAERYEMGAANTTISTASAQIPVTPAAQRIVSSGGAITLTSNPQIPDPPNNKASVMYLVGGSNTNTVTLKDGQGLRLSADITLLNSMVLVLVFVPAVGEWLEVSRSTN